MEGIRTQVRRVEVNGEDRYTSDKVDHGVEVVRRHQLGRWTVTRSERSIRMKGRMCRI